MREGIIKMIRKFTGKKHIVFDFEVLKKYWLVVALIVESGEIFHFDTRRDLIDFYNKHYNDLWIGYNSNRYDKYILKFILLGASQETIKRLSDYIVKGIWNDEDIEEDTGRQSNNGYDIVKEVDKLYPGFKQKFNNIVFNGFDLYQFCNNRRLKELEGYNGSSIIESSVDFNLDRDLTDEEKESLLNYCIHDVTETARVLVSLQDELKSYKWLIDNYDLPVRAISYTKPVLASIILGARKKAHKDEFALTFPDFINDPICNDLVTWFNDPNNRPIGQRKPKTTIQIGGVDISVGWGGIHGAVKNYIDTGEFWHIDVNSYYPNLMIKYKLLSRNVTDPDKFKAIVEERLARKRAGDKGADKALKIVINSTYGASGAVFNDLYDPLQMHLVCIYGQLFLINLIIKLAPVCKLININTDGLFIKITDTPFKDIENNILKPWENLTGMQLKNDPYTRVIQRDVNSYLILDNEGNQEGKGALMKDLGILDNNKAIIRKAVRSELLENIPIRETVNKCRDLIDFQIITKIGKSFDYATLNGSRLDFDVNRVFASNDPTTGLIQKCKIVDGEAKLFKIPGTPEHCFIDNERILGKAIPPNLDREFYINEAQKELNNFIGLKPVKAKTKRKGNTKQ